MQDRRAFSPDLGPPLTRRNALTSLAGLAAVTVLSAPAWSLAGEFKFGLTPVFRSDDLELLERLEAFLQMAIGVPVRLVTRRTYQEITSLLVSGQIDAAWICGYPFVQYRQQLSLVAVPVWRGKPLYRSYLIAPKGHPGESIDDLRNDVHAFSDPDSNSGFLVTSALLAERNTGPDEFFRKTFFTYGHRNVIRAVASGLADSGSVDGYVWEAMAEGEPELTGRTEIVWKSELLGFPPIACPTASRNHPSMVKLGKALTSAGSTELGRELLQRLKLDGFTTPQPDLYDSIAAKVDAVRSVG